MATMTKLMLTNPEFDFDAYLINGGKLLHLVVPDEQERFWLAGKLSEELLSISRRWVSVDQAGSSRRRRDAMWQRL
jgi:hypothetical protein